MQKLVKEFLNEIMSTEENQELDSQIDNYFNKQHDSHITPEDFVRFCYELVDLDNLNMAEIEFDQLLQKNKYIVKNIDNPSDKYRKGMGVFMQKYGKQMFDRQRNLGWN